MVVIKKIKIGIFSILSLIIFILITLSFWRIEVIVFGVISYQNYSFYLSLDLKNNEYIKKNNIKKIKIIYSGKYYPCKIYFHSLVNDVYTYFLSCNEKIKFTQPIENISLLVDEVNIYQYYLKK